LETVKVFDEVQGVREEAKRLKSDGINILIAVGHAGYLKDREIAEQVLDIDVVVGGHTNTFLWNGKCPQSAMIFISHLRMKCSVYFSRYETFSHFYNWQLQLRPSKSHKVHIQPRKVVS
jgi:hypothetical protein